MTNGQRHYRKNGDVIRARARQKYHDNLQENRERAKLSMRRTRQANPAPGRAYCKAWYEKNGERVREQVKIKRRSDPVFWRKEKEHNLKRLYGITMAQYEEMQASQGGLCAICERPETYTTGPNRTLASLAVDHDRETGQVRDLLCCRCNRGIGLFAHGAGLLEAAAAYVRRHHPAKVKLA